MLLSPCIVCTLQSATAGILYICCQGAGRSKTTSEIMNCLCCEGRDAHYCRKLSVEMRNVAPCVNKTVVLLGVFKKGLTVEYDLCLLRYLMQCDEQKTK